MRKIGKLKPGTIFNYAQKKFVVLEQMEDGVFCLLAQSEVSRPFNSGESEDKNDYRYSTLRKDIEEDWLGELFKGGAKREDLVMFEVDLRAADQSAGYGSITAYAAPLTLWQYGKYKELIPLNEDDWWWLVTPFWTRWLRSPYCDSYNDATYALVVNTNGNWFGSNCSYSYGVRPALKLNSELLVSIDGEEDEESDSGDCDNYSVDLSRVDTLSLLREVERRLCEAVPAGPVAEDKEDES